MLSSGYYSSWLDISAWRGGRDSIGKYSARLACCRFFGHAVELGSLAPRTRRGSGRPESSAAASGKGVLRITARLPDPLRNPFSWRSRSRAACATETPRSFTNLTASSLNSRLNFRLCIPTLQFRQTPYLGVHETGSRAELAASLPRHALDVYDHFKGKCPAKLKSAAEIMPKPAAQQGTDGKLMPSGSLVQRDATLPLRHIRQPAHARDLPICQRRQRGSSSCDSMQARLACPWPRTATRRSETWTRHGHWPSAERWGVDQGRDDVHRVPPCIAWDLAHCSTPKVSR